MEGTLAEIRLFAGNFNPRNWAYCWGQLLPINQNQALFSLLGTTYGGDGRTTFGLPDSRGRMMISDGHGPGLSNFNRGAKGGNEWTYLQSNNLANHNHIAINNLTVVHNLVGQYTPSVSTNEGDQANPVGNFASKLGNGEAGDDFVEDGDADTTMGESPVTVSGGFAVGGSLTALNTGASTAMSNMAPYLALNYIICTSGVFPSRS